MSEKITYSILGLGAGLLIGLQASKLLNKKVNDEIDIDRLKEKKKQQKIENQESNQKHLNNFSSQEYKNMMKEQLVRNIQFFGEEGQQKIQDSYIIIFGVGGVGSHVAASLARSGVAHLKIVDFDQVSLSSLNRHAFATHADVGLSKCECVKDYIKRIVPHTRVDIVEDYVTKENVDSFFKDLSEDGKTIIKPAYVVDCIDNIDAKVSLLAYCKLNGIKVISSMGAGMKADPTRIQIRDISETNYDDLSRAVRTKLKKYKVNDGIKVVLSVERSERELLPLKEHQESNPDEYKVFSNYRLRIVPVLGTMPALVAYSLSSYVLCDLAGQLYKPFLIDEVKQANYAKLFNNLQQEARKIGISYEDLEFDMEDIYIVAREIYDWKEVVTDKKACGGLVVRWNPEQPFKPENFVLLNFQDAKKHSTFTKFSEVQDAYPKEILEKVVKKQQIYRNFISKKPILYK
ncbi:hypothetical protein ABPG72_008335 [Tetrahymena utriculariae]